jgi:ATP-binding cassette subfamily F protein 3
MNDYRALLTERARPARAETPTKRTDRRDRAESRAQSAPLRRAAKEAEARVQNLLSERQKLESRLADPNLYVPGKATEVTAANTRLAAIAREIEAAELAWLEAEEAMEAS